MEKTISVNHHCTIRWRFEYWFCFFFLRSFKLYRSEDVLIVRGAWQVAYFFHASVEVEGTRESSGLVFFLNVPSSLCSIVRVLSGVDSCVCTGWEVFLVFGINACCFLLFTALSSYVSLHNVFEAPLCDFHINLNYVVLSTASMSGRCSNIFASDCNRASTVNPLQLWHVYLKKFTTFTRPHYRGMWLTLSISYPFEGPPPQSWYAEFFSPYT